MKQVIAIGVIAALCALPVLNAEAKGGAKASMPKMTCEEVLVLDEDLQPVIVGWIDGYNSKGKLVSEEVIDDEVVIPDAAAVIDTCKTTPKAKVSEVIRKAKSRS